MEARLVAVFFVCSDGNVRQAAFDGKQLKKLNGVIKNQIHGGTLKLISEPVKSTPIPNRSDTGSEGSSEPTPA